MARLRRNALQHLWAELSEKLSDVLDPAIKYGGGTDDVRQLLTTSETVASIEKTEIQLGESEAMIAKLSTQGVPEEYAQKQRTLRQQLLNQKQRMGELLTAMIAEVEKLRGLKQ